MYTTLKGHMVWVCGCSFTGTAGLNPAEDMDVCLLRVLCVAR